MKIKKYLTFLVIFRPSFHPLEKVDKGWHKISKNLFCIILTCIKLYKLKFLFKVYIKDLFLKISQNTELS